MCRLIVSSAIVIIGWGFCDIQNNQGRGKGYQPKPKADIFGLALILQLETYSRSSGVFVIIVDATVHLKLTSSLI